MMQAHICRVSFYICGNRAKSGKFCHEFCLLWIKLWKVWTNAVNWRQERQIILQFDIVLMQIYDF